MTLEPIRLDTPEIRACLEGVFPASVASASDDGRPNVTWLSLVHRLDETHVGLSRQFFRKTHQNILVNPRLQLLVLHPENGRQYQLNIEHERTETEGPRFEAMRAQLDAVASQSGMGKVFRLKGLDVCRVVSIVAVPAERESRPSVKREPRAAHERLHAFSGHIAAAVDVEDLIARCFAALDDCLGYPHAMLLLVDGSGQRLYTVASHGYPSSGAGSEVRIGEGHIGVAAERRQSILATNLAKDTAYTGAVRRSTAGSGRAAELEREVPLPGLSNVLSQLAVPVTAAGRLLGVLCLQSELSGRFTREDEQIVGVAAAQIGLAMAVLQLAPTLDSSPWRLAAPPAEMPAAEILHYASDDSVFIDNEYVIKGVAGRVLWRILRQFSERHRTDFSNKEIRLDQTLALPDLNDNLEARLILLRRRLEDRCTFIHIVKTGRGRFRLNVDRPLMLQERP
jgi:adenylate cyclase